MIEDLKEILGVCIDLICIARQLADIENGCGADYEDVITDLKWNRMVLQNRLNSLKEGG